VARADSIQPKNGTKSARNGSGKDGGSGDGGDGGPGSGPAEAREELAKGPT